MKLLEDNIALMKRRVVDLAGCLEGVKVELDGTHVQLETFEDYAKLYLGTSTNYLSIYEHVKDGLEICVVIADGNCEQVSFVNNVATKGSFRSTCKLTPHFLKKIANADVMNRLLSYAKNDGIGEWKLNIPKLEDAYYAATTSSEKCTLILTQGNSAKAFAMSGLSVVGQDYYGVFPLKGKLLNVREASPKQLQENTEIQNIKKILGLQDGKIYENVKELRYGHLMIMADQDHNGSHFKGLLINFLHSFWPSLLKVPNFMLDFIPPIVKASTKETTMKNLAFYSSEYEAMRKQLGNQFTITSYKEFESEEGGKYNYDQHIKDFVWDNDEDGDAIERAFSNKKIEERKHWLQAPQDGNLDLKEKGIRYSDFMNKEFKQYAKADLQRSIPSMVDGLKPHERKILFYALKKPIIQEIEVTQFSIYVLDHSLYHDGEVTLVGTIIGMTQNYVGSNNINLLQSNMQLGTRLMGGKDHSSARDIFTQLSPITRYIFHKTDEHLLNYLNDNGQSIEPAWDVYSPIRGDFAGSYTGWEGQNTFYKDYTACNDAENVNFEITMTEDQMNTAKKEGLWKKFKLTTRLSTANMHLFDEHGVIKKYDSPEQILEEFFDIRLRFYEKRAQLCELEKALLLLKNKERYIRLVCDGEIKPVNRKRVNELEKNGLEKETEVEEEVAAGEEKPQGNASKTVPGTGYHYLLSMDLRSFTEEKIEELKHKRNDKQKEVDALKIANPKSLWLSELIALDEQLHNLDGNYISAKSYPEIAE
ncbi:DNA topoisomerase 2, partial [Tanacetum coccineum]